MKMRKHIKDSSMKAIKIKSSHLISAIVDLTHYYGNQEYAIYVDRNGDVYVRHNDESCEGIELLSGFDLIDLCYGKMVSPDEDPVGLATWIIEETEKFNEFDIIMNE